MLRAAGTSHTSGTATWADSEAKEMRLRRRGIELASTELLDNFGRELTDFEERVRAGTAPARVVKREKSGGGTGALDPLSLALLLVLACVGWRRAERSKATVPFC